MQRNEKTLKKNSFSKRVSGLYYKQVINHSTLVNRARFYSNLSARILLTKVSNKNDCFVENWMSIL